VQVGVFASAPAVGGIVISSLLGRRFDRRPTRAYAAGVAVLGAVGLALLTATRSFPLLVLVAASLLGAVAAAFPQLFALARVVLGDGQAGQRSAPLLRSAWSVAWAVGPLVGAALLARSDFRTILLTAAGVLGATAAVTLAVPAPPRPTTPAEPAAAATDPATTDLAGAATHVAGTPADRATPPAADRQPARRRRDPAVRLATASVVLFFTAMYAGSVVLPLFVTRALRQPDSAVGLLFSACAAVEVVAALGLAVPARASQRLLILCGMASFILYFGLTAVARGMGLLLVGQVARGVAIAVVGAAGIRFFQELLAPATGRATTLFANASTAGSLVSGVLAGAAIHSFGYRTTVLLCGAAAVAATATFWTGTLPPARLVAPLATRGRRRARRRWARSSPQ